MSWKDYKIAGSSRTPSMKSSAGRPSGPTALSFAILRNANLIPFGLGIISKRHVIYSSRLSAISTMIYMRVRVRLEDDDCSGRFSIDQGLRHGSVLAPLLLIYFAAVMMVVYKRLDADSEVRDDLVRINQRGANGRATVIVWTLPGHVVCRPRRCCLVIPSKPRQNNGRHRGNVCGVWPHSSGIEDGHCAPARAERRSRSPCYRSGRSEVQVN